MLSGECILSVAMPVHLEALDQKDLYSACRSCVLSRDPSLSVQVQRVFMKWLEFRYRDSIVFVFKLR